MKVFKPPHAVRNDQIEGTTVFLAGSIEMGKALPWADCDMFKIPLVSAFEQLINELDAII